MGVETNNTKRLEELLKPHRTEFNILKEALGEVAKEENEKKKDAAKGLLRQALDLQKQMDDAERQFSGSKKKFDKELGKVINKLAAMAQGKSAEEADREAKEKEEESANNGGGGGGE